MRSNPMIKPRVLKQHVVLLAVPRVAMICLALALFGTPAAGQTGRANELDQQIYQLQLQIESYLPLQLDNPEAHLFPGAHIRALDPSRQVGEYGILMTHELMQLTAQYAAVNGVPGGGTYEEWLRNMFTFSDQLTAATRQQISDLRWQQDQLILERQGLQTQGGSSPWFGSWTVTSTHVSGDPNAIGRNFTSLMTISPSGSGCTASFGTSTITSCRIDGQSLELRGRHPSGGAMTWDFWLEGNGTTLSGTFDGTIGSYSNAFGTYTGHRN